MLRRSFLKFIGAAAGAMGLGGIAHAAEPEFSLAELLAQGNTAQGSDIYICTHCVEREEIRWCAPEGYKATTEDELWHELQCAIAGHEDEHDRVINVQRMRCQDQWASARTKET